MEPDANLCSNTSSNFTPPPQLYLSPACSLYDVIVFSALGAPMVFFGLIGNILCLIVLRHNTLNAPTIFLLKSLAITDSMVLLIGTFLWVLPPICQYFNTMPGYYDLYIKLTPVIWPSYQITYTATILITLLVSANRHMMVCRHSHGFTKQKACSSVLAVVIFSFLYNLPRFYEYQTEYVCDGPNNPRQVYGHSAIGASVVYRVVYLHVLHLIVLLGGPIVILVYLNTQLIRALRQRRQRRTQLLSKSDRDDESDVTRILIVVVFVFIACNTPTFVDHLFWTIVGEDNVVCGHWLYFYTAAADMCVMLNSSVNFLIYAMTSPRFRQTFVENFCLSTAKLHFEQITMNRSNGPQTRTTDCRHSSTPGRDSDDVARVHNGTAGACGNGDCDPANHVNTIPRASGDVENKEVNKSLLALDNAEALREIINVEVYSA